MHYRSQDSALWEITPVMSPSRSTGRETPDPAVAAASFCRRRSSGTITSFIMRDKGKSMTLDWPTISITTVISVPVGFVVGLLVNSTSERWKFWKKVKGNRIEITNPRPGEIFRDSKNLGPGLCFRVTGRIGFVPEGHRIWLLVQPRGKTGYWPQGFERVTHDPAPSDD